MLKGKKKREIFICSIYVSKYTFDFFGIRLFKESMNYNYQLKDSSLLQLSFLKSVSAMTIFLLESQNIIYL